VATVAASEAPLATVEAKPAEDDVAATEAQRVAGVAVELNVEVTRRRWFWWRLALRLVARRLH